MVQQTGLLGNFGQNMQRGFGRIGDAITGKDPNARDQLAIALMSLSGNPQQTQALQELAANRITERRKQDKINKTADFLRSQGLGGAAGLMEAGIFTGSEAINFSRDQRKRELAEQAAALIKSGDTQGAMAILAEISPTAIGQQLAARLGQPGYEILGGGKYTLYRPGDGSAPTITPNQNVIDAEREIAQKDKVAAGLPTVTQKAEDADFEAIQSLDFLIQDANEIIKDFGYDAETNTFKGPLSIGVDGYLSGALGSFGVGEENIKISKARDQFDRFKTRLINTSLRLNKGVQTEGDAQRAAKELGDARTEATAYAAMIELLQINERARAAKARAINDRRKRLGFPPTEIPDTPEIPSLNWSLK
jgi:hypothetical protein